MGKVKGKNIVWSTIILPKSKGIVLGQHGSLSNSIPSSAFYIHLNQYLIFVQHLVVGCKSLLGINSLLATELLAPKGTFITKIFRSQDYSLVLYCLRQLFEKVEVTNLCCLL
ncbi:hypothetical protein HAX54_039509 [Datura stramonium]|uniref:Ribosomal RNA methyltransferase FtsJ domain-containing protein n=1 Tax=Datura stramonium TaxID=4076 RepID=A0ABS8VNT2_DATST|nr:hypothetical protein [Datura stramonium]